MAIYTKPDAEPRQRGSNKGNTFTRTANGFIIRKRFMPTIVRNGRTTRLRAKFLSTAGFYRTLSQTEKTEFGAQAATSPRTNSLGQVYYLTGQQRQNSQNQNRLLAGNQPSKTAFPDVVFPPFNIVGGGANANPPLLQILVSPDPIPAGLELIVESTPLGYYTFPDKPPSVLRILDTFPSGTSGVIDLWTQFVQVFGEATPVVGQTVIIAIRLSDPLAGQKSVYEFSVLGFT